MAACTGSKRFKMTHREQKYVAVLAPCSCLSAVFPDVKKQGVQRLEECLGFPVKLLPSTELKGDDLTPEARAADINFAFGDPNVVAIISTIGGDEGVRVLPFLDSSTIVANKHKRLLGFSDVTSLHLYLWRLGVVSLYGGALLCQFAISGPSMHDYTRDAIRHAILEPHVLYQVRASSAFQDGNFNWADTSKLKVAYPLEMNPGWEWHGWENIGEQVVSGVLWGGCLEVLYGHFATRKYMPSFEKLRKSILFLETSEEFPDQAYVYHFFQVLGELGLLDPVRGFAALLMGRPQTVSALAGPCGDRDEFRAGQKSAVRRAVQEYCAPDRPLPVVFGLDFGHTDPQCLVPSGGTAYIDNKTRTIHFDYSPHEILAINSEKLTFDEEQSLFKLI